MSRALWTSLDIKSFRADTCGGVESMLRQDRFRKSTSSEIHINLHRSGVGPGGQVTTGGPTVGGIGNNL